MRLKGKASVRKFYYSVVLSAAILYSFSGHAQTIEETYQRALKEGGALNVYGTLTPDTAAKVLPVFEKRFPGIKAVNTGASSDKIVARAISEARGGRTIDDVFHMNLEKCPSSTHAFIPALHQSRSTEYESPICFDINTCRPGFKSCKQLLMFDHLVLLSLGSSPMT